MPAPINNNTPAKTSISADNRAKKQAHAFVEDKLRDLDYAHKNLAEDLISSYIKGDTSFNGHKSTFTRRLKYLLIRLREPSSSNEVLHLTSQFLMLDQIRRSVGISLKEIRSISKPLDNETDVEKSTNIYKNPSVISPSGLPKEFSKLLQVPSSSGINYLEYIKNNVEMAIFANFSSTKELDGFSNVAGISDPISRTALINSITYYGPDEIPAFYWAMASSLVHEAAHIEWDWSHEAKPADPLAGYAEERYAYIMRYNFLNDLLSNAGNYGLEKHIRIIEGTIKEIELTLNDCNKYLGYTSGDFSLK